MTDSGSANRPAGVGFDAVLFDLDGVVTRTARLHAAAWKALFDDFLRRRAEERQEPFVAFDVETDYLAYVERQAATRRRAQLSGLAWDRLARGESG